jgi:hypothetical protein
MLKPEKVYPAGALYPADARLVSAMRTAYQQLSAL